MASFCGRLDANVGLVPQTTSNCTVPSLTGSVRKGLLASGRNYSEDYPLNPRIGGGGSAFNANFVGSGTGGRFRAYLLAGCVYAANCAGFPLHCSSISDCVLWRESSLPTRRCTLRGVR